MRKHYIQTNVHVIILFSVNISCDAELIDSNNFSVPSDEVLRILKGMQRNDVQQFLSKVVEHFESSSCHHVGNECFEVIFANYSIYLHVHIIEYFNATSCRNGFSFHNFYRIIAVLSILIQTPEPSWPYWSSGEPEEPSEAYSFQPLRRSPRKHPSLPHSNELPQMVTPRRSPRKTPSATITAPQIQVSPFNTLPPTERPIEVSL